MTVLDVLMSRVDAFLYVGAIIAGIGFLVGVVATMVLTSTVREHGYFHIMLEREAARASEDLAQLEANFDAKNRMKMLGNLTDKIEFDYYVGFNADDSTDEDDELPVGEDVEPWLGNDSVTFSVDVAADGVELNANEDDGFLPAEAVTAIDVSEIEGAPGLVSYNNQVMTAEEFAELAFKKAFGEE
jgi:hypothetical protein